MTRWILLRHGQSTANADGVFSGHQDVPLTLHGYEQALSAGRVLRNERIGRVVSSDLMRAADTAAAAMAGRAFGMRTTPALRERDLGAWTGRPIREVYDGVGYRGLRSLHAGAPGGECLADVARRALPYLHAIDDGRPTLVVGHGGLLRVLLGLADGTPEDEIGQRYIPNALPIVRELPRGRWGELAASLPRLSGRA